MAKYLIVVVFLFLSCKTKQDKFNAIIKHIQNKVNTTKKNTYIFIPSNMCNGYRNKVIDYINTHPSKISCIIISDTKREFENLKKLISLDIDIYYLKNNNNIYIDDTSITILKIKEKEVKNFPNNNIEKIIKFLDS